MTGGFINIHGQTKLPQTKQNQIEYLVKEFNVDILHMQETQIDESAFENNPFIANNFNIIFNNSETGYGVCSLINRKFSTKDELLHPSGRIIAFNIGDLTMTNIYLPSGAERTAKNLREDLCGQTIPNMMLAAKKKGMIGGNSNLPKQAPCPSLAGQLLWRPGSVSWASWMMSNVHSPHSKNLRCWMQGSGSLKGPQDLSSTGTQQRRNASC